MGPRLRHAGVTFGQFPGGFSGGATPDPIPNSVVKPTRANGTDRASDRESRSLPGFSFLRIISNIRNRLRKLSVSVVFWGAVLIPSMGQSRDLGVLYLPVHEGKFTS